MTEYFEPEMGQAIFGQPYQGLGCPGKPGRAAGAIVQKEDHPKLYQMYQDGYLNSEIGQRFGVSGTTAGKLIRKYEASMGGSEMGDSHRFCLNCQKTTRWHKSWHVGHSQCKECGFPSLWGVKCPEGKTKPDDRIIEERAMELGYMMSGPRCYV